MLIDKIIDLDYGKIRQKIILFMKSELRSSKRNGFVIGLSGGLDSSVVVKLASEAVGSKLLVLILPSTKMTPVEDIDDAITLSKKLNIKYNILDLEQVHSTLVRGIPPRKLAGGNLLARLRMCMLYYYANRDNLMVVGTSNRSDLLIG